ncbi:hypothetical protein EGW08_016179, partial [Elysia chlorotica]
RFIQGSCGDPEQYLFYHWQLIDTFIYFSHHFVTIPPPGWIHAAHTHGVDVLGTIITEWDDGAAICKQMLESFALVDELTTKLANIAAFFGFDGWLINIENKIEPDQIPPLQTFIKLLTQKCHTQLQFGSVLWYDSVINTGELKWQDELNSSNEMFFELCDGIFLNYCITKEKMRNSREKALHSGRQYDVYVGIDCFGRGTPGGGGFNLRMVLEMILAESLSCAFFAPGWVLEHLGPKNFEDNNDKFWGLLSDLLNTRPTSLPFSTSFCQGKGEKYFLNGKVILDKPWYNLGLQQLQPSFTQSQFITYHITEKETLGLTDTNKAEEDKERAGDTVGLEASSLSTCDDNSFTHDAAVQDNAVSKNETHCSESNKEKKTEVISEKKQAVANPTMTWDLSCGYNGGGCICLKALSLSNRPMIFKLMDISEAERLKELCVTWKSQENCQHHFALMLSPASEEPLLENAKIIFDHTSTSLTAESLLCQKASKSISFLTPEQFLKASDHGSWTTSKYNILPENLKISGIAEKEDMTLSAMLIPSDGMSCASEISSTSADHQVMCIWIGQIQALTELPSSCSPQSLFISNIRCLEVKAGPKLTSRDVEQMVMDPCFKDKRSHGFDFPTSNCHQSSCNEADNKDVVSTNSKPYVPGTQQTVSSLTSSMGNFVELSPLHLTKLDLTNQEMENSDSYTMHYLLKWDVGNIGTIDLFNIYLRQETGSNMFLGSTYSHYFIHSTSNEIKKLSFFLQPVI